MPSALHSPWGRTREEGRREDGGETVAVGGRCFFLLLKKKQFVVPSPSRKHQLLFPLNQQCEDGVSVWVKTKESREMEAWWGDTYSSAARCHLLPFPCRCSRDTQLPAHLSVPPHFSLLEAASSYNSHQSPKPPLAEAMPVL